MTQAHWDSGYACGKEDAQAGREPDAGRAGPDWRAGYDQGYRDGAPRVIKLERRSRPDQLRYLAEKLSEGERWRGPVAAALILLADELAED